jgi:biopolymer transport protein ExbD
MAGGGGGTEELNLVPYLDIMVNLIMFMLVVTAYLVELKEAPVMAPAYGGSGSGEGKPKPYLSVAITNRYFGILSSDSNQIPAFQLDKAGAEYPYAALTSKLREYKATYGENMAENLVLVPDTSVPYSVVVATMDAARTDKTGTLFPGITMSVQVQ